MGNGNKKRVLLSFALAHLLMAQNWARIIDHGYAYFFKTPPDAQRFAALTLEIILFALIVAGSFLPRVPRRVITTVLILIALDGTRIAFGLTTTSFKSPVGILVLIGVLAATLLLVRRPKLRPKVEEFGILALALFGGVTIVSGMLHRYNIPELTGVSATSKRTVKHSLGRNVVLAVFDELDPFYALERWPTGRRPNSFQRLSKESITFANTRQAGRDTIFAIPGILSGLDVDQATPVGASAIRIQGMPFQQRKDLLSETSGMRRTVLGWYHPYERLFSGVEHVKTYPVEPQDFGWTIWHMANLLVEHPLSVVGIKADFPPVRSGLEQFHRENVNDFRSEIDRWGQSPDGFTFLHIPVPHEPFRNNNYYDSVDWAGEVLEQIRLKLERSKKPYSLLVTSDHCWRNPPGGVEPSQRVPLMVFWPGVKPTWVSQKSAAKNIYQIMKVLIQSNQTEKAIINVGTNP